MEQCKLSEVNERIREAAQQAASVDGLSVPVVERFLRTGDETWDGAGSGRFTLAQLKEDEAYTRAAKTGLCRDPFTYGKPEMLPLFFKPCPAPLPVRSAHFRISR